MTADRLASQELPLRHEFLAIMLGVRRASVTEVPPCVVPVAVSGKSAISA